MRLVVKKLELVDLGQLHSLVVDHLDGIESGLTVLDSRVLLGQAAIDIVALDAEGALVLITAGFTADENMLLKAVEAYSWCLEYPDAIRRLYPSVEISAARPPRLMFVVDRLPDAFHRKIKQLGFSEVDCVEFRHLDVSGTPAAYFDTIARLRRGPGLPEFTPAPIARRVSEPQMRRAPEMGTERPVEKTVVDRADKVVPLVSGPSPARATSVRLQRMLNTHGSSHDHGMAPVIEIAARVAPPAPPVPTPRIETPAPQAEIAALRAEAARIEMPTPHIETPAPRIELPRVEIATPSAEAPQVATPTPRIETPAPRIELPRVEIATPSVEAPQVETPAPHIETPAPRIELPRAEIGTPSVATPSVETPPVETPAPRVERPQVETALPPLELLRAELAAAAIVAPAPRIEIPVARVETPAAVVEPTPRLTLRGAVARPVPTPAAAAAPQAPEPRVSFAEIAKELLGTATPAPRLDAPTVIPRPAVEEITRATLEALAAAAANGGAETNSAVAIEDVHADVEIQEAVAGLGKETAAQPVAPPAIKPIVEDKPTPMIAAAPKSAFAAAGPKAAPAAPKPAVAAAARKLVAAAPAVKATTVAAPAPAPAAAPTPAVKPAAAEPAAPHLPEEFEGLKFPNDGVLTRQWMEFLNQMASSK